MGRSEERIGAVIRERGGLPNGFVLSTKLDRDMETLRFDAAQVRRSVEESLHALGLDHIPLLHLHDPEHARDLGEITCEGGALDELFKLKEEGLCTAVGLAMGDLALLGKLLRVYRFDALISHNRWSLLNRSAGPLFDYAASKGIAVLNAAPYAGGVLAKGSGEMARVTYQEASSEDLEPVRRIETICGTHGLAPGAVALDFSMSNALITSTVVGVSTAERVPETLAWSQTAIPRQAREALSQLAYSTDDPEAQRVYQPG